MQYFRILIHIVLIRNTLCGPTLIWYSLKPLKCYILYSGRINNSKLIVPLLGLGDAWGALPPPRESTIRELGSHLLQVRKNTTNFVFYSYSIQ